MESLYIQRHDAFLRWSEIGAGEPLIWLPGVAFPALTNFLPVIAHGGLVDHRSLYLDYLGSGASDVPADFDYGLGEHAGCILDVMDHLGIETADLIGFSQGGAIAIELAIQHPDRVGRLIICEGNITPGGGSATSRIAAYPRESFAETGWPDLRSSLAEAARGGDWFSRFLLGGWGQADPMALHGAARSMVGLRDSFADEFLALDLPRHFIVGERSLPADGVSWTADIPPPDLLRSAGVEYHVVPGSGHLMTHEATDTFVDLVRGALGLRSSR